MKTTVELLAWATDYLGCRNIRNSRRNSEELLSYTLGCSYLELYLNPWFPTYDEIGHFSSLLNDRAKGRPVQYITGETEFMGLKFMVTEDVFIPRPETEILVEAALNSVSRVMCHVSRENGEFRPVILDLGTGCGNIAISLTKFLPTAKVIAIDISKAALNVARENAVLNKVEDRILFIEGDLFDALDLTEYREQKIDIIISNPPYISKNELKILPPEVKFEPPVALDGGEDGLTFYRRIIKICGLYLKDGGNLILEMGFEQSKDIQTMFISDGHFKIDEIIMDYNNIERILVAARRPNGQDCH